ncbi:3-keto-5-aminohexanoate cleavage protein [Desulfotomaculum copahuensis]|uniref:3-keto-5-aminohexanoate cleavage protein n=1 Tax=Desulfotomaculum copahuensis TaxID=1838280 RepID=A0A1B7LH89_9FIRM|nr:3-keto-5-aminohexanoate cleavage protein [Desulfotomaculum copahuensis]OAT85478.1 3-keto-5-aminohexanoate cleavage protein [Desulfotomaculum copahuensis]
MSDKVIVTAAITGAIHTPSMSPHLPITPKQIADEAVRAWEEGAAVAHIHVRNPEDGLPVSDLELFKEVVTGVKSRCNIILCLTTGGSLGATTAQRVAVVPAFKPELASFNFGSINFALFHVLANKNLQFKFEWEKQYLGMTEDYIFPNTFKTMREYCQYFNENDTKPELEIYDLGMINNVAFMLKRGFLKKPVYLQFVMGILGAAPATLENLLFFYRTARDTLGDFTWSVCAAGRHQINMCTASLLLGGNVRVGLEDNLYLEKGVMAGSNAEQVAKIVRIARELGREPATPDEARQILGLKGIDKVNF